MHGTKDYIFSLGTGPMQFMKSNFVQVCKKLQEIFVPVGNQVSFPILEDGKAAKSEVIGENKADFE